MLKNSLKTKLLTVILAVSMLMPQASLFAYAEDAESAPAEVKAAEEELAEEELADEVIPEGETEEPAKKAPMKVMADEEAEAGAEAGNEAEAEEAPKDYKFAIGEQKYETLGEALNSSESGDTVTFLKDYKGKAEAPKISVTLDLAGNTWKAHGGSNKQIITVPSGADVTIKNGTITGTKNLYSEEKGIINNGTLTIEDMKFTGNEDGVIENNKDMTIRNSLFTGNNGTRSKGGSMYIIKADNANAKTTIENSTFKDNKRTSGSIIYAYGSYYASQSRNELTLKSCDIVDNTIDANGTVYCSGNVKLNLDDTTIKNNDNVSTWDGTGGIYFSKGTINWVDSACYNNKVIESKDANDFYIVDILEFNGSIPLPQDMSDHGTKLAGYELIELGYNFVAAEPLTKAYAKRAMTTYYRTWTVRKVDGFDEEAVAMYDGKTYSSIQKAVEAVDKENATVTLLKDVAAADQIEGKKGLTIDLNGHTVTSKKKTIALDIRNGENVTIKNGTIGHSNISDSAVYSLYARDIEGLVLEDLTFTGIKGRGVFLYHNYPLYDKDENPMTATLKNCKFIGNGVDSNAYMPFALMITGYGVDMKDCVFDGNSYGFRYMNNATAGNEVQSVFDNCTFKNHVTQALNFTNAASDTATFRNCTFEDNNVDGEEKAMIALEEAGSGANTHGGNKIFENCVIRNNKGATYTLHTEVGELVMNDCLIEGNSATNAGGLYISLDASLKLNNTVIKNNEATGTATTCSGGVSLFSATKILITPIVNGSGGGQQELGFASAGLIMNGGAIYNNRTNMSSPSAEDLYVSGNCSVVLPKVSDFKDGDKDFSGLQWKDDGNGQLYDVPANTSSARRYFVAGARSNIKQIYVDGVDGDDANEGTKAAPVLTFERAKELAELNGCKTVLVLNTVSYEKETPKKRLSALEENEEEETKAVLDMDGITVKRDSKLTKEPLIKVEDGASLTIKDVVMDGNAKISVKALAPLVKVEEGGALTLDEGSTLQYNGISAANTNPNGGAVWTKGDLVMKDGATVYRNYAITGGGILVDGGSFKMEGGHINDNVALWKTGAKEDYNKSYGGGVCVIHGGNMIMEDGLIENNQGLHSGGGVALGTKMAESVVNGGTCRFYMLGGKINNNKAYSAGGGVFVQASTEATIVKGEISGNLAQSSSETAHFAGGGIYVNGYYGDLENLLGIKHGKLNLTNVELANNTAKFEGGAFATCGSGRGQISELKGTVMYDNDSEGKGNSVHKVETGEPGWSGDFDVLFDNVEYSYDSQENKWTGAWTAEKRMYDAYIGDRMLNGAEYNWEDQNGDRVSAEKLRKIDVLTKLNTEATASDADVQKSVALATVHVNGNRSESNGGGIGCNGEVYIGQLPEFMDIPFEKKWDDPDNARPRDIKVWLVRNGERIESKIVEPDEDGNWKGSFNEQLKYELNKKGELDMDKPYKYTVEEDMDYRAIGKVYTSKVVENEDHSFTITNTRKPEEKEEEEEKKEPEPKQEEFKGEKTEKKPVFFEDLTEPEKTPEEAVDEPEEEISGGDKEKTEKYKAEPEDEPEDEPEVISGGSKEEAPKAEAGPKTGDDTNMIIWIIVGACALTCIAALVVIKKKKH